jgi:hypothetical protein
MERRSSSIRWRSPPAARRRLLDAVVAAGLLHDVALSKS